VLPKKEVTLADIAAKAGVSVMTVSRALRNQANISPVTQQRIQGIADEMGYRPNPLVSALMTYRRSARPVKAHLNLGFLTNFATREAWKANRLYEEFFEGVGESADKHGYGVETFWMREPGLTAERLTQILETRSIYGLVIAPLPMAHGHLHLDWDKFSAVTFGYSLDRPQLHRAANHQFRSMRRVMIELRRLGYKRLGLTLPASLNERVDRQWVASFLVEQLRYPPDDFVPILVVDDGEWTFDRFRQWCKENKPDVIISHEEIVLDWLRSLKVRVPDDIGFVHLNCYDESGRFAGIYQNGAAIGVAATDMVIAMINRNERGIPELPRSLLIEGTWVEGQTVRVQRGGKAANAQDDLLS
jgi:LacI family transcriptional regulator